MPFEQGLEIMDHELSGPTFCTPNGHTTLVRDALEDLEARRCHVKTLTKKKSNIWSKQESPLAG